MLRRRRPRRRGVQGGGIGGGLNCGASAEEAGRTARALLAAMRGDEELIGVEATAVYTSDANAVGHLNFTVKPTVKLHG